MDMEQMRLFVARTRYIKQREEELAQLKAEREAMKQDLMEAMIEEGMVNATVDLEGEASTIYIDSRTYVGRADDVDPEQLMACIEEAGMSEMVSRTVPAARLSAWARELAEAAAERGVPREELVPEPLRGKIKFAIDNDLRVRASSRRAPQNTNASDA